MIRCTGILCLLGSLALHSAAAQAPAVRRAALTITEADIKQRIFIIADDSMGGRGTPSPGLTKTANYIASEFRRFGLKPGGDSGSFLQHYPMASRAIAAARSTLRFSDGTTTAATTLAEGAAWLSGATTVDAKGTVVLLGGVPVADSISAEQVRDRVVVYVPPASNPARPAGDFQVRRRLGELGARAVVVVVDDSAFANYSRNQLRPRTVVGAARGTANLALLERGLLAQVPEAAEVFAQLRASTGTVVLPMDEWAAEVSLRDTTLRSVPVPNVVGILEGSDPVLKNEYLVYSAHMDHIGTAGRPGNQCRAVGADSICNGADDDGSGTVAVVELAQAFSQPGAAPKRSVIFLTVSGEEGGLWGSDWFAGHPPVPVKQLVANLNIDMIGRNWKDTVVAIGRKHSNLGETLERVNQAHPELRMTAIDDPWPEERFYERSDHYHFAVRGVPILFFFSGVHQDYHQVTDSPDKIDAEKESRIVRLLFYLGQEVGNAAARPAWKPESYRAIVQP